MHPAAVLIEDTFGIDAEQVMDIFENGYGDYEGRVGFGRIIISAKVAEMFEGSDLTWDGILEYHLAGNGFGGIIAAYKAAEQLGTTGAELMAKLESGMTWGEIRQEANCPVIRCRRPRDCGGYCGRSAGCQGCWMGHRHCDGPVIPVHILGDVLWMVLRCQVLA